MTRSALEEPASQMRVGPLAQVELAILLRGGCIDSYGPQLSNAFVAAHGIDDVNGLLATFEAILDEWQEHTVFVVVAVEKGTDVTVGAKDGAPDSNRLVGFRRIVTPVRRRLQNPCSKWRFRQTFNHNQLLGQSD